MSLLVLFLSHCGQQKEPEKKSEPNQGASLPKQNTVEKISTPVPASVVFEDSVVTLKPNQIHSLTYAVAPDSLIGRLPWISSDTSIIYVNGDMLIAKAAGTATISLGQLHGYVLHGKSMTVVVEPVLKKTFQKKPIKTQQQPVATVSQPKKNGKIKIVSSPAFAQIQVDGEIWGETPMTTYKAVPAGAHHIQLKHRNYSMKDTNIQVNSGSEMKIKMNLKD